MPEARIRVFYFLRFRMENSIKNQTNFENTWISFRNVIKFKNWHNAKVCFQWGEGERGEEGKGSHRSRKEGGQCLHYYDKTTTP